MKITIEKDNVAVAADIVLRQLCRLDGAIEKEFTLINDRMTAMIVSESFIFVPFALVATAYKAGTNESSLVLLPLVIAMLLVLPVLGIAIVALAYPAILAAHRAADALKLQREGLEDLFEDDFRATLIPAKYRQREPGSMTSRYLPPIIGSCWGTFFVVLITALVSNWGRFPVILGLALIVPISGLLYLVHDNLKRLPLVGKREPRKVAE